MRDEILRLSEAMDPQRQGEGWPDPIAWDGRPLIEQARDLLALALVGDGDDPEIVGLVIDLDVAIEEAADDAAKGCAA